MYKIKYKEKTCKKKLTDTKNCYNKRIERKFCAQAACIKEIADDFEGENTCCFLFYLAR